MDLPDLVPLFAIPIGRAGFGYMVTGSVAAAIYGEPRLTRGVDLVLALQGRDAGRLAAAFPSNEFYVPPAETVILRKLEFFKQGGSSKHLRDIAWMLQVSVAEIDRPLLERKVSELGLEAQWATALATPLDY